MESLLSQALDGKIAMPINDQSKGTNPVLDNFGPYIHAAGKMLVAWGLIAWGALTLQHIVMTLGGVYSALQIYILWRDKIHNQK